MKKRVRIMLSVMLASTMVLTPVYATESIDLDSMSVEDLQNLQEKISEKLKEKGEDDPSWDIIPQGVYKVGADIKAGQFEVEAIKDTVSIKLYESEDVYKEDDSEYKARYPLYYDEETGESDSAFLSLSDGQIVAIEYGSAFIKEASKASWMPD